MLVYGLSEGHSVVSEMIVQQVYHLPTPEDEDEEDISAHTHDKSSEHILNRFLPLKWQHHQYQFWNKQSSSVNSIKFFYASTIINVFKLLNC